MTAGFVKHESRFRPGETMDNLVGAVSEHGLTVFLRLDHAAAAAKAGSSLRPTELLVFGRAEGGTPLMQADQAVGVDLPLRALVWVDAADRTWIGYDDPLWIADRHGLTGADQRHAANALSGMLETCTIRAAGVGG